MFNQLIQSIYGISYDDWFSKRRLVTDTIYQVIIGSAQSVISTKYLIAAHQITGRLDAPDKNINISRFDNLNVRN